MLDALAHDGERIAGLVEHGPLDAPIASCPGWDLQRLVSHLGRVHRWAAGVVRGDDAPAPPAPDADALPSWFRAGVAELGAALRAADLDTTVATPWGVQPRAALATRMAVETALHRTDAEAALGSVAPLDRAVAVAGLDELFTVLAPAKVAAGTSPGRGETLHLCATDGEAEWLVALGPDALTVRHEHADGDCAVRGAASDLLLLLCNRPPLGPVDVLGDGDVLVRWGDSFRF